VVARETQPDNSKKKKKKKNLLIYDWHPWLKSWHKSVMDKSVTSTGTENATPRQDSLADCFVNTVHFDVKVSSK